VRQGIRTGAGSLGEISSGFLTWEGLRDQAYSRSDLNNPFLLTLCLLAPVALANARRWRLSLFYAAASIAYLLLALGPNGGLFPLYMKMPLGTLFKDPNRALWVTGFCVAVLVALGVDAVVEFHSARGGRVLRAIAVAMVIAASTGYYFLVWSGFGRSDWVTVALTVGGVAAAALAPRLRGPAVVVILAAMVSDLLIVRPPPVRHLLPDGNLIASRASLFTRLRREMTGQDRAYLAPPLLDLSLQERVGSLFAVPVLFDYDPQPTRRWAAYFVMMRTGRVLTGLNDWGYVFGGWFPPGFQRRLLDLAAARYVVAAATEDGTRDLAGPALRRLWEDGDVRVYENPAALPRARWVPRVDVIPDPAALLRRLASSADDPREVAFVEEPTTFVGRPGGSEAGEVVFTLNDPEHLTLRVHAPQRGFLLLADQYFPGWRATVDGVPTRILRANYAFRLVEVPAGESVVDFEYVPVGVWVGLAVSMVAVLVALAVLIRSPGREEPQR